MAESPLIDIRDLSVGFRSRAGKLLPVLRNIDLTVSKGETIGIVGESGSGKSTVALAAMGYLKRGLQVLGGAVRFNGHDLFALPAPALQALRGGRIALIPQNSGQSLTPTMKIGKQLAEALMLHSRIPEAEHPARILELLRQVRLPDPAAIAERYPHELSGGQQQRAAIAMALAGEAEALLLDEPTTGLDVTTQAHVLELLRDITAEFGTAMVYVSHDLGAIARVCDRVAVMYAGEVVLTGATREVLRNPAHPYARGLLGSIPRLSDARLPVALDGRPPPPGAPEPAAGSWRDVLWRSTVAARNGLNSSARRRAPPSAAIAPATSLRCPRLRMGAWPAARPMEMGRPFSRSSRSPSATPSRRSPISCLAGSRPARRRWPISRSASERAKRLASSGSPAAASRRFSRRSPVSWGRPPA